MGLAAWSSARVGYLHDEITRQASDYQSHAQQEAASFAYHAVELQTSYLLHVAEEHSETEHEIDRYREQFKQLQQQFRLTELKYDNVNFTMRRAGLSLPGDYWTGPGGNFDSQSFNINRKGK